jgi:hypothetical protein
MQEKRAVKRGDAPPPEPKAKPPRKTRHGPTGRSLGAGPSAANVDSARKLQSAFVKVGADFLEATKILASETPLPRPMPENASLFPADLISAPQTTPSSSDRLTCPKRPKWRFDMTKKEVEKNEEGLFKKWLDQMDGIVDNWRHERNGEESSDDGSSDETPGSRKGSTRVTPHLVPRAPPHFERNLEVWRQLCVDLSIRKYCALLTLGVAGVSRRYLRSC